MANERLLETVSLRSGPKGNAGPLIFPPASVNVFVGPNHSGKSLLLREIQNAIQNPEQAHLRKVLKEITFHPLENAKKAALVDELRGVVRPSPTNPASYIVLRRAHWSQELSSSHFEQILKDEIPNLRDVGQNGSLRNYFLSGSFLMLGGAERLGILAPTTRESPHGKPRSEAYYNQLLSRLFFLDEKRKTAQAIINDAFHFHFVINPLGSNFEARISPVALPPGIERSLCDDAVDFFAQSTAIEQMSDGVRAYCGMVTAVVASDAKIMLIDEPEAFLHPALCDKLAQELCRIARTNGQQLFIATHSAPFLMGCVQAGIDLNIVRLTYQNGAATSRLLPQGELVPLMRQPLLRSIGALTGIFYESVVVTESESDRAFYDEVNHRCLNAHHASGIPEGLFLNAQNWQTTARIIAPLRRLGVAAAAIIDIDLLLEGKSEAFQTLVEAAGIPSGTRTALGQLRGELHGLLKPLSKELKKMGISCVSDGGRRDLENLVDQLGKHGVFVVPVGELEGWLPSLVREAYSNKNEWLLRTFEAMGEDATHPSYLQPSAGDVWDFLARVQAWLRDPIRHGMAQD